MWKILSLFKLPLITLFIHSHLFNSIENYECARSQDGGIEWWVSEARVSMRDWKEAFHLESIKWIIKFYCGESLLGARLLNRAFFSSTLTLWDSYLKLQLNKFLWMIFLWVFFWERWFMIRSHVRKLFMVFCDTCVLLILYKNGVIPSSQVPFYF